LTPARLIAVGFIYCGSAVAWSALGGSVVSRSREFDGRLAKEVASLWGGQHNQLAPDASLERPRRVAEIAHDKLADGTIVSREVTKTVFDRENVPLIGSRIEVDLQLDQRRKGLLWYDTYAVTYKGTHRFKRPADWRGEMKVRFGFPSAEAIYDGFKLQLDGRDVAVVDDLSKGVTIDVPAGSASEHVLEVAYRSRGLGEWTYAFAGAGIAQVRDFELTMTTDFTAIDFPPGTLSPTTRTLQGGGHRLAWRFESLVTGQKIGMDPPNRLNPGPLAARITFFAPVGLLFFLVVMVILGVIRGRSLHPMNYFFLAAAFFAFHLLLAYLVDHVDVHLAFGVSAAVSVFLVVSYLRLVAGLRTALVEAGLAQLVFLVLFSYAFFFEGYTGLTVTVGAVATLYVLMQLTARVDWERALAKNEPLTREA
jgi:hypothetical protein